jgi:hypothetical protein
MTLNNVKTSKLVTFIQYIDQIPSFGLDDVMVACTGPEGVVAVVDIALRGP